MRRIVEEDQPFIREEVTREDAIARLEDQPFKREIVESIGTAEGEVAGGEVVSLYRNDGWVDLCEGPHVPSTGRLGAFRLTSTAGAYWRGVETNPMLTRIYGTAWATQEDLDAHLLRLEEAEKRDHRRLGRELDLFSSPDELGPGLWIWHPRGGIFRKELEDWVREPPSRRAATTWSSPRTSPGRSCGRPAATSRSTGTTCIRRWRRTPATTTSSR